MHGATSRKSLQDSSGYSLKQHDLDLVGLTWDQVARCAQRNVPLGMTVNEYRYFADELRWLLEECEGIRDADIRLQGSSARGFSSMHKPFPRCAEDVLDQILQSNPSAGRIEVEQIWQTVEQIWRDGRPLQRPFDSMHRLKISGEPSDYDIQISSDLMVNRVSNYITRMGLDPSRMHTSNEKYNFVRKELAAKCFAHLERWSFDWQNRLGRAVTWALFDSSGPPHLSGDLEASSSHHRDDDWRVLGGIPL